jgi:hypothetical protein
LRTSLLYEGFEVLPAEDVQDAMKVYEECKRRIDSRWTLVE